jgi:hypothetical protein
MKLVMTAIYLQGDCKICESLGRKFTRRDKEVRNIERWQKEGGKFKASIDRAFDNIREIDEDINRLNAERQNRQQSLR